MASYTRTQFKRTAVLLGSVLLILSWLLWANSALQTTHYKVESANLPAAFDGYKVAQVSDLHNAQFGKNNQKLLEALRRESPDMIALTGDTIDSHRTDTGVALEFARAALHIAPVYCVTGNHEMEIDSERMLNFLAQLEDAGVIVLRDATVELKREDARIEVVGVDDPAGSSPLNQRLPQLVDAQEFSLVLSHRPEEITTYAVVKADVVLTGHAHGGQVRLPWVGGLFAPNQGFFPEYDAGVYAMDTTQMVVSRGLGNSLIPLRINNRPELVIVTLSAAES